jgi:hypothetical protein
MNKKTQIKILLEIIGILLLATSLPVIGNFDFQGNLDYVHILKDETIWDFTGNVYRCYYNVIIEIVEDANECCCDLIYSPPEEEAEFLKITLTKADGSSVNIDKEEMVNETLLKENERKISYKFDDRTRGLLLSSRINKQGRLYNK